MPQRALAEKRPYLVASIVAAISYYGLRDAYISGISLALIKGAAIAFLAVYAQSRHRGRDGRWIAAVMSVAALADVVIEFAPAGGGVLYFVTLLLAAGLFLTHRRAGITATQGITAAALLLLTPLICWSLSQEPRIALYGLALGVMAGSAWISRFSRYHVGVGAVLFVAAAFLLIAQMRFLPHDSAAGWFIWPLYYCGQFLICTGVIQTLRRDHQA